MARINTTLLAPAMIAAAAILLAACGQQKQKTGQDQAIDTTRLQQAVIAQPVTIEYSKQISSTERIRGIGVPYSGNVFTGKPDNVRCLLYTNDAYKVAQIICPDSSERYPQDVVEETGTPDPIN